MDIFVNQHNKTCANQNSRDERYFAEIIGLCGGATIITCVGNLQYKRVALTIIRSIMMQFI